MDCRIRLAQIDTTLGNLDANLEAHLVAIEKAASNGVELVVFPELSLTGYFLKDQTAEVALELEAPELQVIAERSRRISIAIGFVERGADGRVFNSVGFFENGELLHVHRKVHLVNYGMFEESRDLASGDAFEFVESKHGRFGILTCEDMWHVDGSYLYFLDGVDAFLVCSASPGRGVTGESPELESSRVWRTLQDAMTLYFRTWTLYVNRVGWEDGILFAGGSRVVDPFGREVAVLPGIDPAELDVRITSDVAHRARIQTPLRRDERPWILARELARRVGLERGTEDEDPSRP